MFWTILYGMLVVGDVLAHNGCRQCTGEQLITFKDYVTLNEVRMYLKGTLNECATGGQYEIDDAFSIYCLEGGSEYTCKDWNIGLKVWRYCGNGSKVRLRQNNLCIANICVELDNLILDCTKSVECHGKCDCRQCGC